MPRLSNSIFKWSDFGEAYIGIAVIVSDDLLQDVIIKERITMDVSM